MPVVGLLIGHRLSTAFSAFADYGAAGLLIFVGVLAVRDGLRDDDEQKPPDVHGIRLLLLGLSVSIDELAVGFSLGVLRVPVGFAIAFVGGQAFVLTFLGLSQGQRMGKSFGERAEMASGVLLILLGLVLVFEHWTGVHFL